MRPIPPFDELRRELVLHVQQFSNYTLEVKPLSLTRDITEIHKWVNMEYAKAFWQMEGSFDHIYHHYQQFLESSLGGSLMFFLQGSTSPVAQMDFYNPRLDEIGTMYDLQKDDIGIHLLMGPPTNPIRGLTTNVMICGISFLFSLGAKRIIGEPDIKNSRANKLVSRVGFRFLKSVELSYKTANLYVLLKKDFLKNKPDSGKDKQL